MLNVDGVEMLDVREAARAASRTPETIRRWIWSGRLTAIRSGNRLLVARHDLERAGGLAAGQTDPPSGFHEWSAQVREARRLGRLGELGRHNTAADLVLADRADRAAI